MLKFSKIAVVAAVALGGIALQSVEASAMPVDTSPAFVAHSQAVSGIQETGWHGHGGWHRRGGWHRGGWRRRGGWHRH